MNNTLLPYSYFNLITEPDFNILLIMFVLYSNKGF